MYTEQSQYLVFTQSEMSTQDGALVCRCLLPQGTVQKSDGQSPNF